MLKSLLRKIPGVAFLYRLTKESIQRIKKRNFDEFEKSVLNWNFDNEFSDLVKLAKQDHDHIKTIGIKIVNADKTNPKGHAISQACLEVQPNPEHCDVGTYSLSIGQELLSEGKLEEARTFFLSLHKVFPEIYEPYAILYDIIYLKQEEYRSAPDPVISDKEKKPLVLSFIVWGDQYIRFFDEYCIPTMMAEGNLPAVAEIRDISVDIYAHKGDIKKIQEQEMFEAFSTLCAVNFIEFPERLITCEEYKRFDNAFRYNIYGGFHHLSIEKARSLGADAMCLGPDNLYSDGSFLNYVKLVDEGYSTVLFTATRAQAEFLEPVLDKMKDPSTKALPITSDEMVDFSAQYLHHSFLQYIVTDNKTPVWRSGFFVPYENGFRIRSFHYHPVIISSDAIERSKEINWNYTTVDGDLITALFPDEKDWETMKVITDSREGIMIDMAYGSPGMHYQDEIEFADGYLDKISESFSENQMWNFKFTVDYRMENKMKGVRAYLYNDDGDLLPVEFPLTATLEEVREQVVDWYDSKIADDDVKESAVG